jgi:hypothetical protein
MSGSPQSLRIKTMSVLKILKCLKVSKHLKSLDHIIQTKKIIVLEPKLESSR